MSKLLIDFLIRSAEKVLVNLEPDVEAWLVNEVKVLVLKLQSEMDKKKG